MLQTVSQPAVPSRSRGLSIVWPTVKQFVWTKPLGAAGGLIVIILIVIAALAPVITPFDPYDIDAAKVLVAPNSMHIMGTDEFGRDVFSRIVWGARVSLTVGIASVAIGASIGSLIGLLSGFIGGRFDTVVQRLVDMFMAIPMLVLALAMVAALGAGIGNVIIALAVVIMPSAARVMRSSALSIRERPFIEAARNLGFSQARILFRHVLPNCIAPYIIIVTAGLGSAILAEATLSFLGLGTPPPEPSWGGMLSGKTQRFMLEAPWLAIFPGMAITFVVFGFNFLGDALRDVLDPRLRGSR
jgi:peptide/nickel transport system permease protein